MQGTCETCGNNYDRSFTVTVSGKEHIFDSYECAIERLAPRCAHCEVTILGHGVESDDVIYCCDHCLESHAHTVQPEVRGI